jgi:aminopeptidase N
MMQIHLPKLLSKALLLLLSLSTLLSPHQLSGQTPDPVDVLHYRIQIDTLDFSQQFLRARAELSLKASDSLIPLNQVRLSLLGLDVDSVIREGEGNLPFSQNDTFLTIPLNAPLPAGDTARITIHYSGKPHVESYNWGGFHFQGSQYAYNLGIAINDIPHNYGKVMFPCVDDFIDRATYEFLIRAPQGMMAISNGLLQSATPLAGGDTLWHWKLDQSIPTYLACIAVGPYTVLTDTFQSQRGPIPVTLHVLPADTAKAAASFVNLLQICHLFEQSFGPYPFDRIGYVLTPKGAMEHATCISYPRNTVDGSLTYEYLYAHELAHMWVGDMVTCANAGEMWLNEGWATFSEFIYKEGLYGVEARKDYIRPTLRNILQYAHIEEGGYLPLYGMPQQFTYGTSIYDKGACVAHTLRTYLGDSLFYPALKQYLQEKAFQHATSQDMMQIMSQSSGINLMSFFGAWVYGPGFPHFRADSFRILSAPGSLPCQVEVFLSQQGKGTLTLANENRIPVLLMNSQWEKHYGQVHFSGASGSAVFNLPFVPEAVFVDPEEGICDATTDHFRNIQQGGKVIFKDTWFEADIQAVADSVLLRATHHWVAPEALDSALPGFRISDYRYWSLEGILPPGTKGKGRFFFTRFQQLDNGIILNPQDSVVLLYRSGPGHPWTFFPATMEGQTYQGYMVTDTLMRGDYAIGVWDYVFLAREEVPASLAYKVYPNPASDTFTVEYPWPEISALRIYSSEGRMVHQQRQLPAGGTYRWDLSGLPAGIYVLMLENANGRAIGSLSLVKQ